MSKFNIGDTVYHASADTEQIWVMCPECFGCGRLRVILGDDSEVSIACECCSRGYEGSPGRIQSYAFKIRVQEVIITGLESDLRDDLLHTRYKFYGCYTTEEQDLFATKEEAEIRAEELMREREAEEAKRLKYKEQQTKTWAWNVSYWRRQIRDAKRQIESAETRLSMAPKTEVY